MNILIIALILLTGGALGYFGRKIQAQKMAESVEEKAENLIKNAKEEKQNIILKAQEEAIQLISEAKKELQQEKQDLKHQQKRVEERENRLDKQLEEIEKDLSRIENERQALDEKNKEIENKKIELESALEEIAGLSKEEALEKLMNEVEESSAESLASRLFKLDKESEEKIEAKARKILSLSIEKFASSQVTESTSTIVELPSDDMKGPIIGKEGRNIRVLEHLTGCEFIVDDTPQAVTISGFSPVRRHVAKRALEMLIKDGRIQPAKIEETIDLAKRELAKEMRKAGEEALYELGIPVTSIDPKLIAILGRLKFRTSYGQNVLQHSIEVARISGHIAAELGADVQNCIKGGLFHDIGKAVDHDMQGAHPEIGYNIMKKFGWPEELCYQSIAHHEDKPRTLEGVIVKAADAISGARPGARRQSSEDYVKRLQALEDTAKEFEGVEKAYAIQAGREVRVFVHPQEVNDFEAVQLAERIAKKIEHDLTYPGEVRVTVIRETRVSEYAR